MREPFQVLVVPYRRLGSEVQFLLLKRADSEAWQFVAGGGEAGEVPIDAARRELLEELDLSTDVVALSTSTSVPVVAVCGDLRWGPEHLVLQETAFATEAGEATPHLSMEHTDCAWASLGVARAALKWDSNVTAAWETAERVRLGLL